MCTSPSRGKKRCLTKAKNEQNSHIYLLYSSFFSPTANGAKDQLLPFTHREDKQAFSQVCQWKRVRRDMVRTWQSTTEMVHNLS